MPLNAILSIGSASYDVLRCNYSFSRKVDPKGRPHGGMTGGEIFVELESTSDTVLLERMLTKEPRAVSGSLEIWDEKETVRLRTISWDVAYIYSAEETMKSSSELPMILSFAITPLRLDIDSAISIDRRWPDTYGFWWEEYVPKENEGVAAIEKEEPVKTLKKVEWINRNDGKPVEYVLTDNWVDLCIDTSGFEKGDLLDIALEEVNGRAISGTNSRITLDEKFKKDDLIEIKKAFRFSGSSEESREVKVVVKHVPQSLEIESETRLKERNGGIWGMSSSDAVKVVADIKTIFADSRFASFSSLLSVDKNDKQHVAFIHNDSLKSILGDSKLNADDKLAIEMVVNTINAKDKHLVKYIDSDETIPQDISALFPLEKGDDEAKLAVLRQMFPNESEEKLKEIAGKQDDGNIKGSAYGGSKTKQMEYGSVSIIIERAQSATDYWDSTSESYVNNPGGDPVIVLHEIVGHGRSLTLNRGEANQHEDAILFENLLLRIMGYPNIQRDGKDHGTEEERKIPLNNPSRQPAFK